MSDPFRDHAASKRSQRRERVRDEYTPIVLWVKQPEGERIHDVRDYLQEQASSLPYVDVAETEPFWFATDGVNRVECLGDNDD